MPPPLRVAVVNRVEITDPAYLSGTPYFMLKALQERSVEVMPIGPASSTWLKVGSYADKAARVVGLRYDWVHSLGASRELGRYFSERLKREACDVIFAPFASTEIAHLDTATPIVYLSDMTFALAKSYYDQFSKLVPFTAHEGELVERLAVKKSASLVMPSEWAAQSLVKDYECERSRVNVVSFGANLENPPTRGEALKPRDPSVCRLLFLSVNWERKGGSLVLEVLGRLLDAGVKAELTVCGCTPPGPLHPAVKTMPFLRKSEPEEARQLQQLLLNSTLLFLPSKAEAYAIVFAEAAACGLPAITRDTGGLASEVRDGVNGFCLPAEATTEDYVSCIAGLVRGPERYRELCKSSRNEYEARLNWDVWAEKMTGIFLTAKEAALSASVV